MLSRKDYEAKPEDGKLSKVEVQWQEAEEQIKRYAVAPRVEALRQGTTLHKVIMQFVAGKIWPIEGAVNEETIVNNKKNACFLKYYLYLCT